MKNHSNLRIFCFFLLLFYLFLTFFAQSLICLDNLSSSLIETLPMLVLSLGIVVICFFLQKRLTFQLSSRILPTVPIFLSVFTISFLFLFLKYISVFPGTFSTDSMNQLDQALTREYTDWHPVIHTLLFFTLPLKLFSCAESIVLVQIFLFSLALAYCTLVLHRVGCPDLLCFAHPVILLSLPSSQNILMYPWKDTALAISALVLMGQYIQIVVSRGKWLTRRRNCLLFAIVLALATLFRHNAILYTFPLLLSVIFFSRKEKKAIILLLFSFLGTLLLIKIPLYALLQVRKPGARVVESVGMCMVIMGNAVVTCPEKLPQEVLHFLYQVASPKDWEKYYILGDFNSLKFASADFTPIEDAGLFTILRYTMQTILACPIISLRAFACTSSMIWLIGGHPIYGKISSGLPADFSNIALNHAVQNFAGIFFEEWNSFFQISVVSSFAQHIGFYFFILLAAALTGIREKKNLVVLLHLLPMFAYNFGTALLLTGFDWRFFYYSIPVFIPTLFIILWETSPKCKEITE